MSKESLISWTHGTWNPWVGCDKIAPECQHCYIDREIRKQADWQAEKVNGESPKRVPWGQVYLTKTWRDFYKWQAEMQYNQYKRIFTCSLSDFFHAKVDKRTLLWGQHVRHGENDYRVRWRDAAWHVIRSTPNLVYLILTKRPENILSRLPRDWGEGYPNVWIGTSVGCNATLSKIISLRKVPVHPQAVRFLSCEPLLEDISQTINLDGIGWVIAGGESGSNPEYGYDPNIAWAPELKIIKPGRRTMDVMWAYKLMLRAKQHGLPFWFKRFLG
jgi:protein gp37